MLRFSQRIAICIFLVVNIGAQAVSATELNVDSLLNIIKGEYTASDKASAYISLSKGFLNKDAPNTKHYAFMGVEFCSANGMDEQMGELYAILSYHYFHNQKLDSAKYYGNLGLKYLSGGSGYIERAKLLEYQGRIHYHKLQHDSAVVYYEKAVKFAELGKDTLKALAYKGNLASVLYYTNKLNRAADLCYEGLKTKVIHQDSTLIRAYCRILGGIHVDLEDYDQALLYAQRAREITQKTEPKVTPVLDKDIAIIFSKMASDVHSQYADSAYHYFEKAQNYKGKISWQHKIDTYLQAANFSVKLNDIPKVKSYVNEIEDLLADKQIGFYQLNYTLLKVKILFLENEYQQCINLLLKNKEGFLVSYHQLYYDYLKDCYASLGQYSKAFEAQRLFHEVKDSLHNLKATKELLKKEADYKYQLKEQRLLAEQFKEEHHLKSQIKIRRISNVALIIVVLLLLVISWIIYRSFKIKKKDNILLTHQKKNIEEKEKLAQSLLKELNHRVKNNLQMVTGLITMQEFTLKEPTALAVIKNTRSRIETLSLLHQHMYATAKDVHPRLDSYVRDLSALVLNSSGKESITDLQLNIDAVRVKTELGIHVGLIVNELLVNAIKYGVSDNRDDNFILVELQVKNADIKILVADSGNNPNGDSISSSLFGLKLINTMIAEYKGELITDFENGQVSIILKDIQGLVVKGV